MDRGKLKTIIILTITALGVVSAWASDYVVQSGDTLSSVANKSISGNVWGKHGSLNQLLSLNPKIKNADLIFPGQSIQIPTESQLTSSTPKNNRFPASEDTTEQTSTSNPHTAPVATPLITNSSNDEIDQHLRAGLGYHFKTYSAQDSINSSSATLFTSSDIEFDGAWSQDWNKTLSTYFEFGFEKVNFESSNNPNKSLVNTDQSPAHFSLGADIKASSRFAFRTSASYGQELFTGSQGSNISVDSVFIPAISEEVIFTAYNRGRTGFGIEAGGSYLVGASANNYSINSGYAVNGAVFLNQNFGPKNKDTLTLSVGYETTQQNTSLINQNVGDGFAKIMFSMPIFGDDK